MFWTSEGWWNQRGLEGAPGVSAASYLLAQTWHLPGVADGALTGEWGWELTEAEGIFPLGKGCPQGICLQQWGLEFQHMSCVCLNHGHSPKEPPSLPWPVRDTGWNPCSPTPPGGTAYTCKALRCTSRRCLTAGQKGGSCPRFLPPLTLLSPSPFFLFKHLLNVCYISW